MAQIRKDVEKMSRAGLAATYHADLTDSDSYLVRNNGRTFLHVKKTGVGDCTVTIVTPNVIDGNAIADPTVLVVATTGDMFIGPFANRVYNNVNGDVEVSFSEITGLVAAFIEV